MIINGVEAGPSVYEAARAIIAKNRLLIEELQDEIAYAQVRLRTQRFSNMLDAERIANESERFQKCPMSKTPN